MPEGWLESTKITSQSEYVAPAVMLFYSRHWDVIAFIRHYCAEQMLCSESYIEEPSYLSYNASETTF